MSKATKDKFTLVLAKNFLEEEMWNKFSDDDSDDYINIVRSLAAHEDDPSGVNDVFKYVVQLLERNERAKIWTYLESTVLKYSDTEFVSHFRLKRSLAQDLTSSFQDSQYFESISGHGGREKVSPERHVLAFLWFVGHLGASYRDVADRFNLSLSTLHSVISRMLDFLMDYAPAVIKDPTQEEIERSKEHYLSKKGFPGVIGAIDGTHIRIDKPLEDKDSYVNQKHYFSIHIQGIVNENAKFIDVYIGWPGSVHDATVFANSPIARDLPKLCQKGEYILGDAAYPCLPFLMTPYKDNGHLTQAQKNYNCLHSSCQITVDHAFRMLKQRFRQLYFLKLRDMKRMVKLIQACCVLHNIADLDDLKCFEPADTDDFPDRNAEDVLQDCENRLDIPAAEEDKSPEDSRIGKAIRDELCQELSAHGRK